MKKCWDVKENGNVLMLCTGKSNKTATTIAATADIVRTAITTTAVTTETKITAG